MLRVSAKQCKHSAAKCIPEVLQREKRESFLYSRVCQNFKMLNIARKKGRVGYSLKPESSSLHLPKRSHGIVCVGVHLEEKFNYEFLKIFLSWFYFYHLKNNNSKEAILVGHIAWAKQKEKLLQRARFAFLWHPVLVSGPDSLPWLMLSSNRRLLHSLNTMMALKGPFIDRICSISVTVICQSSLEASL